MLVAFPKHKEIKIGKVDFVVEEVTPKETSKGDFMLSLKLKVKDDVGTERIVYDFLIFNDMNTWKIELFGESLGMGDEFRNSEVETDELVGKTGSCILSREEDKSENPRFPYRYMVGSYCIPDSGSDGVNVGSAFDKAE
ncbi:MULTISPECIES: hypothetical protein [Cysteiniphilum]|uniref:hypothetical protein n=1 Tax=Cysteiniphilum TaxID=2056696 RepID=UPI00178244BC|nr:MULTISPECIES: hypothetical protein [Cysteiniphilum]